MVKIQSQLTIVFDPPFYKGIFERRTAGSYEVAQIVFGPSEPKTPAISDLIKNGWAKVHFYGADPGSKTALAGKTKVNPKRLQRLARKAVTVNTNTKAQTALNVQFEKAKAHRKRNHSVEKANAEENRYLHRRAKRLAKHKGH